MYVLCNQKRNHNRANALLTTRHRRDRSVKDAAARVRRRRMSRVPRLDSKIAISLSLSLSHGAYATAAVHSNGL